MAHRVSNAFRLHSAPLSALRSSCTKTFVRPPLQLPCLLLRSSLNQPHAPTLVHLPTQHESLAKITYAEQLDCKRHTKARCSFSSASGTPSRTISSPEFCLLLRLNVGCWDDFNQRLDEIRLLSSVTDLRGSARGGVFIRGSHPR